MDDEKQKRVDRVLDETNDETQALTKSSICNKEDDIDKINDILDFYEEERYVFFTFKNIYFL